MDLPGFSNAESCFRVWCRHKKGHQCDDQAMNALTNSFKTTYLFKRVFPGVKLMGSCLWEFLCYGIRNSAYHALLYSTPPGISSMRLIKKNTRVSRCGKQYPSFVMLMRTLSTMPFSFAFMDMLQFRLVYRQGVFIIVLVSIGFPISMLSPNMRVPGAHRPLLSSLL